MSILGGSLSAEGDSPSLNCSCRSYHRLHDTTNHLMQLNVNFPVLFTTRKEFKTRKEKVREYHSRFDFLERHLPLNHDPRDVFT